MKSRILYILAGLLLMGGSATASTIEATFKTVSLYTDIGVSVNKSNNSTPVYQNFTARAGILKWERTGGTYAGQGIDAVGSTFNTFCVELTQSIRYNESYTYDVRDLDQVPQPGSYVVGNHTATGMGADAAKLIETLWAKYSGNADDSATDAAAFQAAIWEIVYDSNGTLNISDGDFKITSGSAVAAKAQGWLDSLGGYTGDLPVLGGLSSANIQDQVFYVSEPPQPGPPIVPAPMAVWGGAVILAGLVYARIRRNSTQA